MIQTQVDLRLANTLKLPCTAAQYLRVTDASQLSNPVIAQQKRFVLGGGSNLVLLGDFGGLVLHMNICGKRFLREDSEAFYVEACAGENWHDFVQWTLARGWPGLENLSLIPGTVGAAPIQNIGAYGLEVGERLDSVTIWDFEQQCFTTLNREQCHFAYRDSVFKQKGWHLNGRVAITSVVFRLPKQWQANMAYADLQNELLAQRIDHPSARQIADAVISVRQRKLPDPAVTPNVGSFFHNPILERDVAERLKSLHPTLPCYTQADGRVKVAAGWLIDQAGWKGKSLGPVGMYAKQALVLVNDGSASGDDVLRTVAAVTQDVEAQFGVHLNPEPVFLGH